MSVYDHEISSDLLARTEPPERAAAMLLGLGMFALARLDLHLGLPMDSAEPSSFIAKLERLQTQVRGMPIGELRGGYQAWIERCKASPLVRNDNAGGRWVPDARSGNVVSVVTLAGGEKQQQGYGLVELEAAVEELRELLTLLTRLRREGSAA
ncbi:hypothetical protein FN976_14895 [Caenimonas sedimenti]|uniref:Uncharacterized protein n=1 Tax=Caenimonas sedimenti TaxID=2596921 RepID=A0A562ZNX6_9BURK|nr:hypothetical protein [Caenimonas sedimenti]TWO70279.1 hypothetical protein FN976_14895 [Caenimonas sedimenti]